MTWVPFLCPFCGAKVRGDATACVCGETLAFSGWAHAEQAIEDMESRGLCCCCERSLAVCDRDPCINDAAVTTEQLSFLSKEGTAA